MYVLCFWTHCISVMVFIFIILSISDLSFLQAVCIFNILLLFFSFCVILTNLYTFDIMFTRNTPLWLSLILASLPPLYILLIIVCLHCVNVLCSLSVLWNRILRLLTISSFPSFNHSAFPPNLSLALLFFQFGYGFLNLFVSDNLYLICFFCYFLKLVIYFFFNYPSTFMIWFPGFWVVFYKILYIPLVYLIYFPI